MKLRVIDVRRPTELEAAFETMRRGHADALVLVADPMLFTERPSIIQLAARHRVPAVYEHRLFAEIGGRVSYGPRPQERFQRIAVYVDRILRGGSAGRAARRAADHVRAGDQSQDGQGARPDDPALPVSAGDQTIE